MQLTLSTAQHDIKAEIKEEVIDIDEVKELSCVDSLLVKGIKESVINLKSLNIRNAEEETTSLKADLKIRHDEFCYGFALDQQSYGSDMLTNSSVQRTALRIPEKFQQSKAQNNVINHISPPRTFTTGWCSTKRAKLIIQFLENFAEISRRSNYTVSANFNIASNGPRFLQCEKCSRLFSGLHDRFLKIFVHYKTCHKEKCNLLIGLKWVKHQNTVQSMIGAWQRDQLILKHKIL